MSTSCRNRCAARKLFAGVRLQLSEFLPPLPGSRARERLPDTNQPSLFQIIDEVERRIITDMLERSGWNQTEAAERFLIPLSTLNQKIKRLGSTCAGVGVATKQMGWPTAR